MSSHIRDTSPLRCLIRNLFSSDQVRAGLKRRGVMRILFMKNFRSLACLEPSQIRHFQQQKQPKYCRDLVR